MEVFGDILNVRSIKMENAENEFDETVCEESSDPLSVIPQYVTESDLGLIQSGAEILQAPLTVFSDAPDEDDTMQSNDSGEEVVVQLMDIRTRLSRLRSALGRRLGLDLSDYTFWLQDAKMLESHKTLVEQCVRGAGVVQVQAAVRPALRRISILDVLKPDDELLQLYGHRYLDPDEPLSDDPDAESGSEPAGPVTAGPAPGPAAGAGPGPAVVPGPGAGPPHAAAVKWVVDAQFKSEHRVPVPDDPATWSVQHVKLWIVWAVRQFNLAGVRLADWNFGGPELCALTNAQFKEKVPSDPGDLFWTHFELLRKCKFIAVVQEEDLVKDPLETPQSAIKKKPKPASSRVSALGAGADEAAVTSRSGNNGQVQLWQFLLELLTSAQHYHLIRWHGSEGEFKLLEPELVAALWGARKHKPAMNYEKLSRALRYYYDGDMIAKVPGKRFVYKFVCDLRQLLGYEAAELAELVREMHEADADTQQSGPLPTEF